MTFKFIHAAYGEKHTITVKASGKDEAIIAATKAAKERNYCEPGLLNHYTLVSVKDGNRFIYGLHI